MIRVLTVTPLGAVPSILVGRTLDRILTVEAVPAWGTLGLAHSHDAVTRLPRVLTVTFFVAVVTKSTNRTIAIIYTTVFPSVLLFRRVTPRSRGIFGRPTVVGRNDVIRKVVLVVGMAMWRLGAPALAYVKI